MEREHLLVNDSDRRGIPAWNSSILGMKIPPGELNCFTGQLSDCFFGSNCDAFIDQNDPFESTLSSIVSSPVASRADAGAGDVFVIKELIGRLGRICNSGEISPESRNLGSSNTSCCNTPLISPPKLNLSSVIEGKIRGNLQFPSRHLPSSHPCLAPLNADPGFVERAARFSCFGGRNLARLCAQFEPEFGNGLLPKSEPRKLSQVTGQQVGAPVNVNCFASERILGRISPESGEMGDSQEGSSVSELNPGGLLEGRAQNDANSWKRKVNAKAKGPAKEEKVDRENDESPNAKRIKRDEDAQKETNDNLKRDENGKSGGDGDEERNNSKESAKPPEPPKDYIHVRARRGQATDSHSLAERMRREKISERMKYLQDLVPGCNKVTGKAVVLDEIINYVQSLQRQVEFLSMKLATLNPHLELNMDALLAKDSFQSRGLFPSTMYPLESTAARAFPYGYHQSQLIPPHTANGVYGGSENLFSMNPPSSSIHQNPTSQMPSIDGCGDAAAASAQVPAFDADDLHSIVQMGFSQNQNKRFEGTNKPSTTAMKVEL